MSNITGFAGVSYKAGEVVDCTSNEIWELTTDAAITKGRFVKIVTAGHVTTQNATVAGHVGIALDDASAAGKKIRVLVSGIGTVLADTNGTAIGDYVKPDANGKADVATYGTDDIVGLSYNASNPNGVAVVKLMMISKDST